MLTRCESGEQAIAEEQLPGDTSTISQRGRNQLQMAWQGWCSSPQLKNITYGLATLPIGEGPQGPRAPGEGQLDGRLSQTFFRVYNNTGHMSIFRVTTRSMLWCPWVYLKEESHGCLRIARGELKRRSSSCPRALATLKAPLRAIVWAWPDCW